MNKAVKSTQRAEWPADQGYISATDQDYVDVNIDGVEMPAPGILRIKGLKMRPMNMQALAEATDRTVDDLRTSGLADKIGEIVWRHDMADALLNRMN